jgi:PAS domain S-box-containing protein
MSVDLDDAGALLALLDELEDGVALVGARGELQYVNRALSEMFGYEPGELIGSSVERLVPVERRSEHTVARREFVAGSGRRSMRQPGVDVEGRRRDGTHVPIDVQLTSLGSDVVLTVVRDARPQRERAAELALTRTERDLWRERAERRAGALDDVVQLLFGVVVTLESCRADVPAPAVDKVDACIESLRDALGAAALAR